MPAPSFADVTFPNNGKPNALHKKKGNTDKAKFTGCDKVPQKVEPLP